MDGILPLWKEKGYTSHDCVSKARGMLKTRKIGHTGTLDPDVEGVLPLCVGKATKIVPFLTDTEKVYEAVITLGSSTETEDATGEVVEQKPVLDEIPVSKIQSVLKSFTGEITQVPPMYSAVKVKGKRLYQYAREGIEVDRPDRKVTIKTIELLEKQFPVKSERLSIPIRVVCSKGTYIRTLCVDIGRELGFPAHMSTLVRLQTGAIRQNDCFTFDQVQYYVDLKRQEDLLLPLSKGLEHMPSLQISEQEKQAILHGQVLPKPKEVTASEFSIICNHEVIAMYQVHPTKPDKIKPIRVF
ncbi:tRNA pseudouridine(55) synthase TruB [Halobacillus shinanisalinarum]|uniref:tRNA pseudouridine synthase B n=1 Tax=Halobacillus shinanisalinarum TaxID=2932258 RepID=A0ABY4GYU6_9BACI|nr:tRNA pseudouridine(55) synthase TruB [Halobacillus shinanisalinarum]UOQ93259.1 tRNA pseudouridine(55) synthase TruB [Halobacillus shinanisalinarum]